MYRVKRLKDIPILLLIALALTVFSCVFLVLHQPSQPDSSSGLSWGFSVLCCSAVFAIGIFVVIYVFRSDHPTDVPAAEGVLSGQQEGEGEWGGIDALLDMIPDMVWIKNQEGKFIHCNSSVEALLGRPKQDILGKTSHDFLSPQRAKLLTILDQAAVADGKRVVSDTRFFHFGRNQNIDVEVVRVPIRSNDGVLSGVLAIAREITGRKQTEEILKHRLGYATQSIDSLEAIQFEELFKLEDIQRLQDEFSNATSVASLITDPDGKPLTRPSNFTRFCGELIRKNPNGCANCQKSDAVIGSFNPTGPTIQACMSGGLWDAGAAITVGGKHVANWMIGQVRDETQTIEEMRRYADKIGVDCDEAERAFKEVPAMSLAQFRRVSDVLYTMAGQLSNQAYQNLKQSRYIAERKEYEEELEAMNQQLKVTTDALTAANAELSIAVEKAEESDRLKSAFLANMSHEIRTPMNAVLGFSSFLKDPELEKATFDSFIDCITQSGETLLALINDIIDISKIDAGQVQPILGSMDVSAAIENLASVYRSKLQAANKEMVTVTVSLPKRPIRAITDETRLLQILNNLLTNAVKFTSEGSIHLSCEVDGDQLRFAVQDSGIGIELEQQSAVFDRFAQATVSTEKLYGGTGLGLAIAKSCAELLGGRIWVDSTQGEGSTFYFTINFQPDVYAEQATEPVAPAQSFPAFHGEHVLVVEDDVLNLNYLKAALKTQNLRLSCVTNGKEAVDFIRNDSAVDLILMDIQMPVMDGLEATRQIRALQFHRSIVALTAFAGKDDAAKCLDAGCDLYLTKPMRRGELLQTIGKSLQRCC
jgi:PAS domain S-box-containing protein